MLGRPDPGTTGLTGGAGVVTTGLTGGAGVVTTGLAGGAEVVTTGIIAGVGFTSAEAGNRTTEMSSFVSSGEAPSLLGELLSVEGFVLVALR